MKIYEEVDKNGKKIDARILRSKRDLADSLETLLEKKNYDDITIKEICEGALVSKLTFYNNFYDKNELLKFMFTRRVKELSIKINSLFPTKKSGNEVYKDVIKIIIHYFYENKDFYRKVMKVEDQNSFINHFRDIVSPLMEEDIREILGEKTDAEFYVNFFCDAVICAFGRWISQKEPMPPKEFVNMMKSCIKVVAITQERMENE